MRIERKHEAISRPTSRNYLTKHALSVFALIVACMFVAAPSKRHRTEKGTPREYYEGLASAYYPVHESSEILNDEDMRILTFSPDGKRSKTIKVQVSELESFTKEHPELVNQAHAYQCGYTSGRLQGIIDVAKEDYDVEYGEHRKSTCPQPQAGIDPSTHKTWRDGWYRGYGIGRGEYPPKPIGFAGFQISVKK